MPVFKVIINYDKMLKLEERGGGETQNQDLRCFHHLQFYLASSEYSFRSEVNMVFQI